MPKLRYTLPVHTYQVDFQQVVNNAVYVQWMEIGRTRLLEAIGLPIEVMWEQEVTPLLIHTSIDYKRPFRLGDAVHAELWIGELRNASARIEHRFLDADGTLHASGHQVGLFVDRHTLRPRRLTDEQRAQFAPYVMAEG